jgi:hypothetical protein
MTQSWDLKPSPRCPLAPGASVFWNMFWNPGA